MLARFENGNYLEIVIKYDINGFPHYVYTTYEMTMDYLYDMDDGKTEYRSMEMYYPMNEFDYICTFCDPYGLEGEYKILEEKTMKEYFNKYRYNFDLDSEETLIKKELHNDQLFVCLADKEYAMFVLANDKMDAEDYAYDWYCETCFEPGHWKCWKATEDDVNDFYNEFLISMYEDEE